MLILDFAFAFLRTISIPVKCYQCKSQRINKFFETILVKVNKEKMKQKLNYFSDPCEINENILNRYITIYHFKMNIPPLDENSGVFSVQIARGYIYK